MPDFIVHAIPGSPSAAQCWRTLEHKGAAYRLDPLAPGTFRTEPHVSRRPFGRAPVLELSARFRPG